MAKRQRTNNDLEAEDTKGVIRIRISRKNRHHDDQRQRTNNHLEVEVEDTKGFIRIRISRKNRQHDDQKRISKQ